MRKTAFFVTTVIAAAFAIAHADTPKQNDTIIGAWTLNKGASELGAADGNARGREGDDEGRRGNRGGGGRRGGGGFGGGFGRGGVQQQTPEQRDAAQRMRDALRAEMEAPDHIVIVSSDT